MYLPIVDTPLACETHSHRHTRSYGSAQMHARRDTLTETDGQTRMWVVVKIMVPSWFP